ncbi:hypothetical protein [Helicobacter colisuis]|uniref:Uncharacterized protein n=1 Tax=Helicobacter colisuis TaxID=2949739 RepID=A0ABT0TSF1_9HELI|nr:hypothetical protein [Helicobacter colisuis]MCL9818858.1 hypothetical protein [Helicobacter colisuis]
MSKDSQPFVHFDVNKMHFLIAFFKETFVRSYGKQAKNIKIFISEEF